MRLVKPQDRWASGAGSDHGSTEASSVVASPPLCVTYPGRGMALKSNREMAQLCQNAIADLIAGKIKSYSMMSEFRREGSLLRIRRAMRSEERQISVSVSIFS